MGKRGKYNTGMEEKHYKAFSKCSSQRLLLTVFMGRVLKESTDPHATRLAKNALEAAKVCKEDEARAEYLLNGEKAKKFLRVEDWERVSKENDYE